MAVVLTVSDTLDGAQVSDGLAGAGSDGVDLGSVVNNNFAPIVDKGTNDGKRSLFTRHDATIDPVTDFKQYFQEYGTGTGNTYGGASTAALDIASLISLANASGDSKNNGDGNSGGFWCDQNHKVTTTNQFDFGTNGIHSGGSNGGDDTVRKFGDNNTDMIDLASAENVVAAAAVIDSDQALGGDATNGYTPTAPVLGQLGKDADTALGDNYHIRYRIYLPNSYTDGGIVQWEIVYAYSFTA
jgi:hypothetical protein